MEKPDGVASLDIREHATGEYLFSFCGYRIIVE